MHAYRTGAQAARCASLRAWQCQDALCPPASVQLLNTRGIKLFEVSLALSGFQPIES